MVSKNSSYLWPELLHNCVPLQYISTGSIRSITQTSHNHLVPSECEEQKEKKE